MTDFNSKDLTNLLFDSIEGKAEIIPIMTDEDMPVDKNLAVPDVLPILPLKNAILFPGVVLPITVGREQSIRLIREYNKKSKIIGTATQKNPQVEKPVMADLFSVGTVAQILKILEMPDGNTMVILQGVSRFSLVEQVQHEPFMMCSIARRNDIIPPRDKEFDAMISSVKEMSMKIIKMSSQIPKESLFAIKNVSNAVFIVNFMSSNVDAAIEKKIALLDADNLGSRAVLLMQLLSQQVQILEIKNEILNKTRQDIDQQQRDYFLHQQMKQIQTELGEESIDEEIEKFRERAKSKKWSKEVAERFEKELVKLNRIGVHSPDYPVQYSYVQTMIDLPWNEYSEDNFDLKHAEKVLNQDHYGLENIKKRIIQHLAVLKLKNDMKSPILCLYGPPGVGKTSLGKSIARALNRKYCRMSLGGLHDESEIRGHRKTYIGAMPGRIIQNLKKVQTSNPVFVLDEIDKVGRDVHGDPESALLEVLDPEQNSTFYDNYLEMDYDLSKVMFIATANNIDTISPALRDRMEMINISGYIAEEKMEIAKRHLIPNQLKNNGMDEDSLKFPSKTIDHIIINYTRESGVRGLDKKIAEVVRGYAQKVVNNEEFSSTVSVDDVKKILGKPTYYPEIYEGNDYVGVVTGLAWTAVGGEILYIETSYSKGKGVLTLTGNLGNVMKESATIALEYVKSHAEDFGLASFDFDTTNVHLHVPEGAIPKDGPSAGITMVTSIVSALTHRKVRKQIAMTGEITLRGKVLPVGGIKEKILAAKRAGIKDIILSSQNERDIDEIGEKYLKGVSFHYVNEIHEVIDFALL
ncbi:MAG: endopeptidase La [Bacteroidales bacterium]|nr:endopeptidase La [Bacteroidales bacterium]MBR6266001.1 endopeptidase La [Bacteroidales bacterium]MCR4799940.1 endopeptidase La [Bacteroidales bacterium]